MTTKGYIIESIRIILVLLWSYAAASKLLEFGHFRIEMSNQPLPAAVSRALVYLLPALELLATVLLIFRATKTPGFVLSAFLIFSFTIYVAFVWLGFFARHACACGGVFSQMGWGGHLVFNLAILILNSVALIFHMGKEGASRT